MKSINGIKNQEGSQSLGEESKYKHLHIKREEELVIDPVMVLSGKCSFLLTYF
jgi:hypothetical protein